MLELYADPFVTCEFVASLMQVCVQANGSAGPVAAKKLAPESPDPGLNDTHEVIRFLGRGGTGDTHLYKEKATGELVAIKLVKRPIPKVLQPNLLREIKVGW